mmetsp:Transcript_30057/g.75744  ORF Transcript_30057/g.75744 Transcript_30057/m.75744 type:complete len:202 (+) Transcript_30057:380-985(+)
MLYRRSACPWQDGVRFWVQSAPLPSPWLASRPLRLDSAWLAEMQPIGDCWSRVWTELQSSMAFELHPQKNRNALLGRLDNSSQLHALAVQCAATNDVPHLLLADGLNHRQTVFLSKQVSEGSGVPAQLSGHVSGTGDNHRPWLRTSPAQAQGRSHGGYTLQKYTLSATISCIVGQMQMYIKVSSAECIDDGSACSSFVLQA